MDVIRYGIGGTTWRVQAERQWWSKVNEVVLLFDTKQYMNYSESY